MAVKARYGRVRHGRAGRGEEWQSGQGLVGFDSEGRGVAVVVRLLDLSF